MIFCQMSIAGIQCFPVVLKRLASKQCTPKAMLHCYKEDNLSSYNKIIFKKKNYNQCDYVYCIFKIKKIHLCNHGYADKKKKKRKVSIRIIFGHIPAQSPTFYTLIFVELIYALTTKRS